MIEFYKEFYFKELSVKTQLNDGVNIPVIILTGIVSLHVFIYSTVSNPNITILLNCVAFINFFSVLVAIWYLGKSYTNLGKAHSYKELTTMSSYLNVYAEYEKEKNKKEFEYNLTREIADCASHNFEINRKRTEDLARAKNALFVSIALSVFFSIVYILSLIIIKN
ncbi:MAG: hypothetical protein V4580_03120 [Bacteroidota bacterium]